LSSFNLFRALEFWQGFIILLTGWMLLQLCSVFVLDMSLLASLLVQKDDLPEPILKYLFKQANKTRVPIPVRGRLNGKPFKQTLVKYQGPWRLYLNTQMRKETKLGIGDS